MTAGVIVASRKWLKLCSAGVHVDDETISFFLRLYVCSMESSNVHWYTKTYTTRCTRSNTDHPTTEHKHFTRVKVRSMHADFFVALKRFHCWGELFHYILLTSTSLLSVTFSRTYLKTERWESRVKR